MIKNAAIYIFISLISLPTLVFAEPGKYENGFYMPKSVKYGQKIPLVVLLHGCTQKAQDIFDLSKVQEMAESEGFAVVTPEQSSKRNKGRCWNWFLPENQSRFGTEPLEIMSKVFDSIVSFNLDSERVYVVGLSAGGAMAGILAHFWGDFFKAAAIHSAASFKRASNIQEAVELLKNGPKANNELQGVCSYSAIPLMVLHGKKDQVAHISNVDAIFEDLGGCQIGDMQLYVDDNMGHAWSGGLEGMPYSFPEGKDAISLIWKFFSRY